MEKDLWTLKVMPKDSTHSALGTEWDIKSTSCLTWVPRYTWAPVSTKASNNHFLELPKEGMAGLGYALCLTDNNKAMIKNATDM